MPNTPNRQTQYIHAGNPDTDNRSILYGPGELGMVMQRNNRSYQRVQCDSGTTSATSAGVVAANDLAFWKAKGPNYIVTNDQAQAVGAGVTNAWRNEVAGIFRAAIGAGNYCFVLQRGNAIPVNATGGGEGQMAVANSGSDADASFIAVGTAPGYVPLGIAREATGDTTAGMANCDLNIPSIP